MSGAKAPGRDGASFGFWAEWVDHIEHGVVRVSSAEVVVL